MVAPCGTRKRFREIFRFLPGLHGARRTEASQPMQKQHGTREEGNTTHTLHARRVSSFPLAGCVDLVHQQLAISQTATTLLVLDEANIVCGCVTSLLLS